MGAISAKRTNLSAALFWLYIKESNRLTYTYTLYCTIKKFLALIANICHIDMQVFLTLRKLQTKLNKVLFFIFDNLSLF